VSSLSKETISLLVGMLGLLLQLTQCLEKGKGREERKGERVRNWAEKGGGGVYGLCGKGTKGGGQCRVPHRGPSS
jgi:hypothetical protein